MSIYTIKKRKYMIIAISLIIISVTGCQQHKPLSNDESLVVISYDETLLYNGLEIKSQTDIYGYDFLTEGGQQVFDLMYGEYFSGEVISGEKGTQSFKLPEPILYEEYQRVLLLYQTATLRYSRPRFRYDTNDQPQRTHSDMVETVYAGGISSNNPGIDEQFLKAQEKAAEIISEMPPNHSEAEKCRYIAEYLAENTTYFTEDRPNEFFMTDIGYITSEISQGNIINTAVPLPDFIAPYGALINGEANCMGYSRAFAALAYEAGINCIVVLGETKPGYHAWNMVKIDGNWYHIDATWIDGKGGFNEAYFMVNDEQISKSHNPLFYGYCDFIPLPAAE